MIRVRTSSIRRFPAARRTLGALALCAAVLAPMELLGTVIAGAASPSASVVIPSNGSTLSGTSQVLDAFASSEPSQSKVQFEISGGTLTDSVIATTTPTIYGWIALWNTTDVPNGTYTLQSVDTDGTGNSATSPGVSITVDNLLHTQMLVPSTEGTVGGNVILDASAKGTAPVTGVTFTATQGSTVETVGTATPTIYGWIARWPSGSSSFQSGTLTVQSVATEVGGTTATSSPLQITLVTLADIQSSSTFTGNQYPGLAGCTLGASYDATYPGSESVGTVTLSVTPCPSPVFTLSTGVGSISGTIGNASLNTIPPDGLEALYPLDIVTGSGFFAGTSGTVWFLSEAPGTAPFTGSISLTD